MVDMACHLVELFVNVKSCDLSKCEEHIRAAFSSACETISKFGPAEATLVASVWEAASDPDSGVDLGGVYFDYGCKISQFSAAS